MVCLIDVVSGKAVAMTARAVSCDGCLCSVCHYCDQLVSRDPWQMQHGLCSVSGFQTNSVAVTRSLSNVDTLSLQMHFCYLFLKNNAEATVYCTLQIESSVLSFYFCLFPFHLKCSLVGQRNSIAREVLKRSFFYMVFFYTVDSTGDGYPSRMGTAGSSVSPNLQLALYAHHLQGGPVLCLV